MDDPDQKPDDPEQELPWVRAEMRVRAFAAKRAASRADGTIGATTPNKTSDPAPAKAAESEYRVGYGRPPIHTRFKPGVSGNPRGRRKQPLDMRKEIQNAFLRTVVVNDGDKRRHIPKLIALITTLLNNGLRGDRAAGLAAYKLAAANGILDLKPKLDLDLSMLTPDEREYVDTTLEILWKAKIQW